MLTADEREGITTGVQSVFRRLRKLITEIAPRYQAAGFTAPSAGVLARDLSEKIETAIVQHCDTFTKGVGHRDLCRQGQPWEVKVCTRVGGMTINQCAAIRGENYIVVNYRDAAVVRIFTLWAAEDRFFSPRVPNSNARHLLRWAAAMNVEHIYPVDGPRYTRECGTAQQLSESRRLF